MAKNNTVEEYFLLYETGNTGCFLCYEKSFAAAQKVFNSYVEILQDWTSTRNKTIDIEYEPYQFWIPKICVAEDFYDIKSHNNQILNCEISNIQEHYCLYIIKGRELFKPEKLERLERNFFYDKDQTMKRPINLIMN